MTTLITPKQMRSLLQSLSADPQLRQSKDSILLAEDQYPEALDAIFTRLTIPTTLQNELVAVESKNREHGVWCKIQIINHNQPRLPKEHISTGTHGRQPMGHQHFQAMEVLCNQPVSISRTGRLEVWRLFQELTVPIFPRSLGGHYRGC